MSHVFSYVFCVSTVAIAISEGCYILVVLFMAALRSRCWHYILQLWFLSFFLLFSSPISAFADWMSTILRHMMIWRYCQFRMHVWNVLHAAGYKYRTQKLRKKSPSAHHGTTLLRYIFATKACMDNRKIGWQVWESQHISTGLPKSVTLNGLERRNGRYFALYHRTRMSRCHLVLR